MSKPLFGPPGQQRHVLEARTQLAQARQAQLSPFLPVLQLLLSAHAPRGQHWRQREFELQPRVGQCALEAWQIMPLGALEMTLQGLQRRVTRRNLAQLAQRV